MTIAILAVCLVFVGLRIGGVKGPAFQAAAHLGVGAAFGISWVLNWLGKPEHRELAAFLFLCGWALTLVEGTRFAWDLHRGEAHFSALGGVVVFVTLAIVGYIAWAIFISQHPGDG